MITFRLNSTTKPNKYTLSELQVLLEIFEEAKESTNDWCETRRRIYSNCKGCEYYHLCHDINQAIKHLSKEIESGDYE